MVKCLLMEHNIKIKIYAPKQIKKFFTGNGNASKVLMVEKYLSIHKEQDNPIRNLLKKIGESKRYDSPINDLVDASAVLELLKSNL